MSESELPFDNIQLGGDLCTHDLKVIYYYDFDLQRPARRLFWRS